MFPRIVIETQATDPTSNQSLTQDLTTTIPLMGGRTINYDMLPTDKVKLEAPLNQTGLAYLITSSDTVKVTLMQGDESLYTSVGRSHTLTLQIKPTPILYYLLIENLSKLRTKVNVLVS